jgi:hypothetical protein
MCYIKGIVFIEVVVCILTIMIHCKKRLAISRPQPGPLTKLSQGTIKLFPARESLVSDIPAGDGKMANHFLQCIPFTKIFRAIKEAKESFSKKEK